MTLYLNPAIAQGFVSMRYPDKPRHPRQSYLLTDKGTMLWKILRRKMRRNDAQALCVVRYYIIYYFIIYDLLFW
ncbi:MAG: hypothetical protein IKZ67_03770 [Paludibacteraceae bacterium]|nr:hypothetical protein [Paludibacteraceae bacterium]